MAGDVHRRGDVLANQATPGTNANTGQLLVTPAIVAYEALHRLMHQLIFPRLASHNYEKYFSDQIGDTIDVKRPYRAMVTAGRNMASSQPKIDRTVQIKINQRHHFPLTLSDQEVMFSLTAFGDRYLQTGMEELAYVYDEAGSRELCDETYYTLSSSVGNAMNIKLPHQMRALADMVAIPQNQMNYAVMSPLDIQEVAVELHKNVFQPEMVRTAIRKSFMGQLSNWNCFTSANQALYRVANRGSSTPLVRGANQQGSNLITDGWPTDRVSGAANAGVPVLNKGQLFTIAGVNTVKPRGSHTLTGHKMTFTVLEDVVPNGSGQATIKISPEINDGNLTTTNDDGESVSLAAWQNVDSKPADNAIITCLGDSNSTYLQASFHEVSALEYVNIEMVPPTTIEYKGKAVDDETGVSIQITKQAEIQDLTERTRADIMFGVKTVYPEVSMRAVTQKFNL